MVVLRIPSLVQSWQEHSPLSHPCLLNFSKDCPEEKNLKLRRPPSFVLKLDDGPKWALFKLGSSNIPSLEVPLLLNFSRSLRFGWRLRILSRYFPPRVPGIILENFLFPASASSECTSRGGDRATSLLENLRLLSLYEEGKALFSGLFP